MKLFSSPQFRVSAVFYLAFLLAFSGYLVNLQPVCADEDIRTTAYPATSQPDQICLTMTEDPKTMQEIQWRTSTEINNSSIQYRQTDLPEALCVEKAADLSVLEKAGTTNDPVNHRFAVRLDGLTPGTAYTYRVGEGEHWSDWYTFTTAPAAAAPFSFAYMGDPQVGLDVWGRLLHNTYEHHPEIAFFTVAGDNINRGNNREEWDNLFHAAHGVFENRPYVPALGNHDCSGTGPKLYLDMFTLPENGPNGITPERSYSFEYGNALFLILDSNSSTRRQKDWIEEKLRSTKATWKFAVYHHPAYSSAPNRDNPLIRLHWSPLFDKYHLDMALQGHDHGYLRTKPMRDGKEVASTAEGTVYVVSVSGTKFYDVEQDDCAAITLDHVATCQVLDIDVGDEDKLTYRAYDINGDVVDELVIVK